MFAVFDDFITRFRRPLLAITMLAALLVTGLPGSLAAAESVAYQQAVAMAAGKDREVLEFYKARGFKPIWTSSSDVARRRAFIEAAAGAADHGLPSGRYDANELKASFGRIGSARQRAELEVQTTQKFLLYAQDIQSGILEPSRLDEEMAVVTPRRDRIQVLQAFLKSNPRGFIRSLPPKQPEYARLMKEKALLERVVGNGGWGPKVPGKTLKPGNKGAAVLALRARLTQMGHKRLGNSDIYDKDLQMAVTRFQLDHGLNADGVAGPSTLQAVNTSAQTRLQQVIVGLERQRWLNYDLGKRHILVNQADFRAFVIDNGKVTLETRVVVGKQGRHRTPEFADEMTHMVVNPTWNVPKSIARKEYLPMLRKNPNSLGRQGINMTDASGRRVDPTTLDYSQFSENYFPFDLKQPPSNGNALGLVKFMFPNKFNIYLHDTPTKSLFSRDMRAYSHGCVRVQKPFDLAYTLLRPQTSDPKGTFQKALDSRRETVIDLVKPVPVYLVYHTAWVTPDGRANFRDDIYGRDRKIFGALQSAGVVLRAVRG
ncbi:MAG: L,D-transpeptidase family protein [Rhodobacteraceae bacterium]|nr:L,D-transpeptidase family protein [Paracoccaceae bacterium]